MVLTCNLGCVGQGATAIAILPEKRFLTSLACGVVYSVPALARIGVGLLMGYRIGWNAEGSGRESVA